MVAPQIKSEEPPFKRVKFESIEERAKAKGLEEYNKVIKAELETEVHRLTEELGRARTQLDGLCFQVNAASKREADGNALIATRAREIVQLKADHAVVLKNQAEAAASELSKVQQALAQAKKAHEASLADIKRLEIKMKEPEREYAAKYKELQSRSSSESQSDKSRIKVLENEVVHLKSELSKLEARHRLELSSKDIEISKRIAEHIAASEAMESKLEREHAQAIELLTAKHKKIVTAIEMSQEIKIDFVCIDSSLKRHTRSVHLWRSEPFSEAVEQLMKLSKLDMPKEKFEFKHKGQVVSHWRSTLHKLEIQHKDKVEYGLKKSVVAASSVPK